MKKSFQTLLYVFLSAVCMAQSPLAHTNNDPKRSYSRFKVDGTIGGAFPIGYQPNGTFVLNAEAHYRLTDGTAVGFRVQEAFLRQLNNSVMDGFTISPMDSYCLTFERYFSNDFFRPFASFGAGIFRQGEVLNSTFPSKSIQEQMHPGIFPRLGFEIGVLRIAGEYNIMNSNSNGTNPGYLTFTAGFFFGGGGNDRR